MWPPPRPAAAAGPRSSTPSRAASNGQPPGPGLRSPRGCASCRGPACSCLLLDDDVLLCEIDLDRGGELVPRAGEARGERRVGERMVGVLARVERRDRDPVVWRRLSVEDVDHVAAETGKLLGDLDVLARPAREKLLPRQLR